MEPSVAIVDSQMTKRGASEDLTEERKLKGEKEIYWLIEKGLC